jgi:hypothetical protein
MLYFLLVDQLYKNAVFIMGFVESPNPQSSRLPHCPVLRSLCMAQKGLFAHFSWSC